MNFYKETTFQNSEIGAIPSDWDTRKLGDENIARIIAGQSPPSSTYSTENQGLPFLQGKTEFGDTFPSPTVYCSKPIKLAEKDDILLSVRAPVGAVNIAPFECCIGRGLAAIRAKEDRLSHLFLFHYLRLEGKRFDALSTGSTFKAIRMKEVEGFQVPLPPVPEQRRIVGVLGVVDSALQIADQVIAKCERLKRGLMQQLLTRGIGHTETKQTPIGKVPDSWEVTELGNLGELQYGYTTSTVKDNTGVKFLRITDIEENGSIDWAKVPFCNIPKRDVDKYSLKKGDILFARIGATAGKTALVDENVCGVFASYLIRLKTNETIHPKFAFYFTQSEAYWSQALRQREGQLKKGINATMLSKFVIPVPPLEEQKKIAEILSVIDHKLSLEMAEKTRIGHIKQGLMDLLLTGKVRIKVD